MQGRAVGTSELGAHSPCTRPCFLLVVIVVSDRFGYGEGVGFPLSIQLDSSSWATTALTLCQAHSTACPARYPYHTVALDGRCGMLPASGAQR